MKYAFITLVLLLLTACQPQPQTLIDTVPHTANELIYNDILASDFVSTNVTVLGISLGMTEPQVRDKIGPADHVDEYDFGVIKNWQYGAALGLNETGVLYHFEHGILTRILVISPMNKYLHGNSTIGKYKDDIYGLYGTPERQYDLPRSIRFFVYNKKGFEVYLTKGYEFQYAFVYPMRKLPSTAVENATVKNFEVLETPLPTLLTDTTTLCDQGPTYGRNPVTNECEAFENACVIPDHWVETEGCA